MSFQACGVYLCGWLLFVGRSDMCVHSIRAACLTWEDRAGGGAGQSLFFAENAGNHHRAFEAVLGTEVFKAEKELADALSTRDWVASALSRDSAMRGSDFSDASFRRISRRACGGEVRPGCATRWPRPRCSGQFAISRS